MYYIRFFKCSSNNSNTNTGGGNNNNSSNNTNWAEIQCEAPRVEREIHMEGLCHDMECRGIKKGQFDALEQEKKNKKN